MVTGINSEDPLVQATFARYLEENSVFVYRVEPQ